MAMTEYEQAMLDAQSSAASALAVAADVQAKSVDLKRQMKILKQIEGLGSKLKWPHLTRAEKASINQKIDELKGQL